MSDNYTIRGKLIYYDEKYETSFVIPKWELDLVNSRDDFIAAVIMQLQRTLALQLMDKVEIDYTEWVNDPTSKE